MPPADCSSPGYLSWGCHRSPLRRTDSRSPLPVRPFRASPSDRSSQLQSRSVLVVSHHLDGLLLHRTCRALRPGCRPWGSSRFRLLRRAIPATRLRPSEPCSPVAAPRQSSPIGALGRGHIASPCFHASPTTPAALPPRRCAMAIGLRRFPPRSTSRPSAAPGAVPPHRVAAGRRPLLSWACPPRSGSAEAKPKRMGERQRPLRESGSRS